MRDWEREIAEGVDVRAEVRESKFSICAYVGGGRVDLIGPKIDGEGGGGGKRGAVARFTAASRRRLMGKLMQLNRGKLPASVMLFITLTYPGAYSLDPVVWKRDLGVFRKALERQFGRMPGVWKLEAQQRGAPHFHVLVVLDPGRIMGGVRTVQRWVARVWYRVVGSGDVRHLRAGTRVEVARSWRGVTCYLWKYLAKYGDFQVGGVVKAVGRYWGVWRPGLFPVMALVVAVSGRVYVEVRRLCRRFVGRFCRCRWLSSCDGAGRKVVFISADELMRWLDVLLDERAVSGCDLPF